MKKFKKALSLLLAGALALSVAGCGSSGSEEIESAGNITYNGDDIYPVKCDDELSYWMPLDSRLADVVQNFGETPLAKECEKETGIKISYKHPAAGSEAEQFNTMLAAKKLPDMVTSDWTSYEGGADAAIDDGVIYDLTDALKKWAPNLTAYLKEHPEVDKKVKTDSGRYFAFPFVRGEDWMTCAQGLVLRKDWLEKCGLEDPKTIDELEQVLIAFRDKCGATAPLVLRSDQIDFFVHMFGTEDGYYVDGKEVKDGYTEEAYKKALAKANEWYNNGLLDHNIASADTTYCQSKILNGESGAFYGYVVSGIGSILDAKPADQPDFDLEPCALPTETGAKAEFSGKEDPVLRSSFVGISTNCKNVELACRFLDYGFSEAGHLLFNFGIEGESYEMKDGVPTFLPSMYTDKKFQENAVLYTRGSYSGVMIHDPEFVKQSFTYPEQQQHAYDVWSQTNMAEHMMPPVSLTDDENDEYSDKASSIATYASESQINFVTGELKLDDFDSYVKKLKDLGIEDCIKIQQAAYDRYLKR